MTFLDKITQVSEKLHGTARQSAQAALYRLPMRVITNTNKLSQACANLGRAEFVAIDTEFMRETTFWPDLCLIQMAAGDDEIIVDTLADGIDLAASANIVSNTLKGLALPAEDAGRVRAATPIEERIRPACPPPQPPPRAR